MGAYISILFAGQSLGQGDPLRLDTVARQLRCLPDAGGAARGRPRLHRGGRSVGGADVVVLSHGLAAAVCSATAARPSARRVSLDNQAHTIVGVMPAGFAFPSRNAQLWRPLRFSPPLMASRGNHLLFVVGPAAPGVSMEQARADMDVIAGQLQRAYPKDNARSDIAVVDDAGHDVAAVATARAGGLRRGVLPHADRVHEPREPAVCAGLVRRQEIAVRIAIGAARRAARCGNC